MLYQDYFSPNHSLEKESANYACKAMVLELRMFFTPLEGKRWKRQSETVKRRKEMKERAAAASEDTCGQ